MRNYTWKCSISDEIEKYIDFKQLSGLKFEAQERCLQHFDHYFYYNGYEGKALTKDILDPFLYEQDEAVSTICKKETLFLDFAHFLRDRGFHAYMPKPRYEFHRKPYMPHIYTRDERRRFLAAVDSYPSGNCPNRNVIDPVMFRVLIGTGCRLSEVLNLKVSHFDSKNRAIRVEHSKNDRSRIVPLCDSLARRVSDYVDSFHGNNQSDGILFPGQDGVMDKSTAYLHFRDYLFMADIPHTASGPRIHDFRHTMAVENLRRWSEEGKDLSNMLPYLAAYMGHSDFRATQYYLRLTAEIYPSLVKQMEDLCWNIIPEGGYEANEE